MGWASAGGIFDPVAKAMVEAQAPDEMKTAILSVLIETLRAGDWDTEHESLGEFQDDPAIVEAFRRNGVYENCDTDNPDEKWSWCRLEVGHEGDHSDGPGKTWPRTEPAQ